MSNKLNLLIALNSYADSNMDTNSPSLNNFKWNRDYHGILVDNPESKTLNLDPNETVNLFSGSRTLLSDITTTWNLSLKSGTSNTYVLAHNSGTLPGFRTRRLSGADATTVVDVTKNAKLLTFTSTGGTLFTLIANGVVVGDQIKIGTLFNVSNRGTFTIISLTATSFTVENELGIAEGSITLGASYASQVNIYSAGGIQICDKLDIIANFSSVDFNSYDITDVSWDYIEFYSTDLLPTEINVANTTPAFVIYKTAKKFIYIESNKKINIIMNGSITPIQIEPIIIGTTLYPGVFLNTSLIKAISIQNASVDSSIANVFYVTAE